MCSCSSLPGTVIQFGSSLSVSHPNPGDIITLSISPVTNSLNSDSRNQIPNRSRPFIGPINAKVPSPTEVMKTFEVIPSQGVGNFSFEVRVTDSKILDYEVYHEIKFMVQSYLNHSDNMYDHSSFFITFVFL